MNPISAEIVERTWQEIATMAPANYPKIINQFAKEQPFILSYLMSVDEDQFNEDERELLFYLGTVVWRMMSQGDKPLQKVTEEMIFEAEDKNFRMLQYLEGEDENESYDTTAKMFQSYNQTEVLRYVVEALMEEDEQGVNIREDNVGMMMIYLKTIIDCFDK
ncbi:MAG: hypothetical protein ONB31_15735 [candidate division KSB1 bacterium]|nr:hypothetical protein [candidate division KSB1 bacterium]MDZ7335678.1 hypothetical protein [candidate division KSB1 bacterium]MDZ7359030.1 hypothetical protein [candidate division KSB1 bacterium]MDZ7402055.1 hypothetical protein [candidate division KSB1 bacterium]